MVVLYQLDLFVTVHYTGFPFLYLGTLFITTLPAAAGWVKLYTLYKCTSLVVTYWDINTEYLARYWSGLLSGRGYNLLFNIQIQFIVLSLYNKAKLAPVVGYERNQVNQ